MSRGRPPEYLDIQRINRLLSSRSWRRRSAQRRRSSLHCSAIPDPSTRTSAVISTKTPWRPGRRSNSGLLSHWPMPRALKTNSM